MPAALVMMPGGAPYLLGEPQVDAPGWVYRMSLDDYHPQDLIPAGHTIKAATGSSDQLFVITVGAPPAGATQPGDPLHVERSLKDANNSASAPNKIFPTASTSLKNEIIRNNPEIIPDHSAPAPNAAHFCVFWLPPTQALSPASATNGSLHPPLPTSANADALHAVAGDWCVLAPLGLVGDESGAVPREGAHMALAEQNGRLMFFWVDTTKPGSLMMRALEYGRRQQQWSAPRALALREEVPAVSRLFALWLDKTLYVLWTAPSEIKDAAGVPVGSALTLRGGWINTDGKGEAEFHGIATMPLSAGGSGLTAEDVAVGPAENAIVAVMAREDGLRALVFDSRGTNLGGGPVVVAGPRRDVLIGQNIAMVLLALMLTLSLWQWRQKPAALTLPAGRVIAPLHLRAGAFALDALAPYIAVLVITGDWANNGYISTLITWLGLLASPEDLVKATDLFMFIGIYMGHVLAGELIWHRSLGKYLVGLEVVTLEGKAPAAGAMVVRNLVRVPEYAVGVVLLYLIMSERRQRLGDLLARTVVVAKPGEEDETTKGTKDGK